MVKKEKQEKKQGDESELQLEFIRAVNSSDPQLQLDALTRYRTLITTPGYPEQTWLVTEMRAVPILIQLINSPNDDVKEQAIWAVGNIACDYLNLRDHVLNCGALEPLLRQLNESNTLSLLRNATWALSNLCRGKPSPDYLLVSKALPTLLRLLNYQDEEVLIEACWALSYLSDGPNEEIQAVIETGVCGRIVPLLLHPSFSIQKPALRTIGNIVTGTDDQTNTMINAGVLPSLCSLLESPKKKIRKEVCWIISNITAGNQPQIQRVSDSNIIPSLLKILNDLCSDFEIKKEAAFAIGNAILGGSRDQIQFLVSQGCIKPLCNLLPGPSQLVNVVLEALENLLKVDHEAGDFSYAVLIQEAGLDMIERLQEDENVEISLKAIHIFEKYLQVIKTQKIHQIFFFT